MKRHNNFIQNSVFLTKRYNSVQISLPQDLELSCKFQVKKCPFMLTYNMKTKIYRTLTLPLVLYGCETWYLMLKDLLKLRVLENKWG